MDNETFEVIAKDQLARCEMILLVKAKEYATEDRLHNFRVAAELQGVDLLEACAGMMAKHTVSVYDMCASEETFTLAQWNEKITDHMNYLILLRAIVEEVDMQSTDTASPIILDEIPTDTFEDLKTSVENYLWTKLINGRNVT